jgi:hypothetical protein
MFIHSFNSLYVKPQEILKLQGFQSEIELDQLISAVDAKVKKIKNKMAGIQEPEEVAFCFLLFFFFLFILILIFFYLFVCLFV